MHTYKAVQTQENGNYFLEKDGQLTFCPKTSFIIPQQIQHGLQKGQIMPVPGQFNCNTGCPFATIEKAAPTKPANDSTDRKDQYCIKCESGGLVIELDEIVPFKKPSEFLRPT